MLGGPSMEAGKKLSSDTGCSLHGQIHPIQVAPFVAKTFEMASDPMTDELIRWGAANNSFLVVDPAVFSKLLLPSFFKHTNFSSFVRQLNTYGFRKVDPDRWEFAHESFLKGQSHLLPLIIRRRKKDEVITVAAEDEEEEVLMKEVGRLRREQRVLEEEVQSMSRRLLATERKPQQMIAFLSRVAEDPDFLPRIIASKQQQLGAEKKRRRHHLVPQPPPPPPRGSPPRHHPPSHEFTASGSSSSCPTASLAAVTSYETSDLNGGNLLIFSPELGSIESSSPVTVAAAAAFPFSILGEGFF